MDIFNNRLLAYILIYAALAVYIVSEVRLFRRDKKYTLFQRMKVNSVVFAQLFIYHLSLLSMVVWSSIFRFDISQKWTAFLGISTILLVAGMFMLTAYNSWHELSRLPARIAYWQRRRAHMQQKRAKTYNNLVLRIVGSVLSLFFLLLWLGIELTLVSITILHA